MNAELQKQLYEKYPKIFADVVKSPQESCMAWGLEVGDGWYTILDTLCEALTYTYTTSIILKPEDATETEFYFRVNAPQVVADQVKEKFGTLRFYYHLEFDPRNTQLLETGRYPELSAINKQYTDYIDGIVHFADVASSRTCEVTGKPGEMHVQGGWLKVLSPDLPKSSDRYSDYTPWRDAKDSAP